MVAPTSCLGGGGRGGEGALGSGQVPPCLSFLSVLGRSYSFGRPAQGLTEERGLTCPFTYCLCRRTFLRCDLT